MRRLVMVLEGAHGSEREQPDSDQDVMPLDSPPVDPPADNVVTVTAESLEARRRRLRLLGSASSVSAAAGLRSDRETA